MSSFLTVRDVAQKINKSEETVKRYLRAGKFPNAFKISDKEGWRIPETDLLEPTSNHPHQEQLTIYSPITDNTTENETIELVILAYQAVTLTYPTEELIQMLTTAGIHRTLEILFVLRQSENKVKNPVGFIKTALKENWTPNTLPQKVDRRRLNWEARNELESSNQSKPFVFYNWLESEEE